MTIKNKINTNTSVQLSESSLINLILSKSLLKLPPFFRINSVLDTKRISYCLYLFLIRKRIDEKYDTSVLNKIDVC